MTISRRNFRNTRSVSDCRTSVRMPECETTTVRFFGFQMLISRRDKVINLCEMKYSTYDYEITPKYNKELRERCSTFRSVTKTRCALHMTLITPWGLKPNANAGVMDQTVNLDHLFAEIQ